MLRYAIIGFAAAALVSTTLVPDQALARGGGGFRGGALHGAGYRPIAAARRGAAVGAAVGLRPIGAAVGVRPFGEVVGVRPVGAAFGARAVARYYGSPYVSTTLAAQVAQNARASSSIERRAAVVGTDVGAARAAVRAPAGGAVTTGAAAPGGYYGGSYGGYHNYNDCYRDSHGSPVCPHQSSAVTK
jgi:hypothetical protein